MSDQRLPLHIDPMRLARTGAYLQGRTPLAGMERLRPSLVTDEGEAEVVLTFGVDADGQGYVHLVVRAGLQLMCQRCLETVTCHVVADRHLALVTSERAAERLHEAYEPLIISAEPLFLRDIIEDELILSLPIVPRHEAPQCAPAIREEADNTAGEEVRSNPFSALAGFKH